jgi:hypothetical protein
LRTADRSLQPACTEYSVLGLIGTYALHERHPINGAHRRLVRSRASPVLGIAQSEAGKSSLWARTADSAAAAMSRAANAARIMAARCI